MDSFCDLSSQILPQIPITLSSDDAKLPADKVKEQLYQSENFPTFILHVSSLEKKLRITETVFIDEYIQGFTDRSFIGGGATFSVERAVPIPNQQTAGSAPGEIKEKRAVALKSIRIKSQSDEQPKTGWRHVLLEIRALLHETLRHHPHIVHLIGLSWGSNGASKNVYPQMVIELAQHGTLEDLQSSTESPLPFAIKQKLLYDTGRGLSIIHACGIVHGDVNRQNVLIFENYSGDPSQDPYMAKLADFGGAVHASDKYDVYRFVCKTPKYAAPETDGTVTAETAKLCDTYAFGFLVCETVVDGDLTGVHPDFARHRNLHSSTTLSKLKESGEVLCKATSIIKNYFDKHRLSQACVNLIHYVLNQTLQKNPGDRSLAKAQTALRGTDLSAIDRFLSNVEEMNLKWNEVQSKLPPGIHGATVDSLGQSLGKLGSFYDPQDNIPGFRPSVTPPNNPGFVFEPEKLKRVLSWHQQRHIMEELKTISYSGDAGSDVELRRNSAAFFLFRCYIAEFGTSLDAEQACTALKRAASGASVGSVDSRGFEYLAASCLWRVSQALGQTPPDLFNALPSIIEWAILRGSWQVGQDLEDALDLLSDEQREQTRQSYLRGLHIASQIGGAPGWFPFLKAMTRALRTGDTEQLGQVMMEELGSAYEQSLKISPSSEVESDRTSTEVNGTYQSPFDQLFVNSDGHGVLHLAAARGNTPAILYLTDTFKVDINLPSQNCEETPLICACRNGHLGAAMALLDRGADPKGHRLGTETPLHWLCRFEKGDMRNMAKTLLDAGAQIDAASVFMRADIRCAPADWEETMSFATTPLGRCVLFQSISAAEVLVELGANPTVSVDGISAIHLAATLALPKFLRLFLSQNDERTKSLSIFNNFEDLALLRLAQSQRVANRDTFSLLSRLIRNGPRYRSDVEETFSIFKERREMLGNLVSPTAASGEALCMEIRLQNRDIVQVLLKMGHNPSGSPGYRPMREAVLMNDENLLRMLIRYGGRIENYPEQPSTLLYDLATRPAYSPPGTAIATQLIAAGISIHHHPPATRPPVVEAILREYYDLANLLIQQKAQIESPYQLGPGFPQISILNELIQQRTEMSLSTLGALLGKNYGTDAQWQTLCHNQTLNFIVDHIGDAVEQRTGLDVLVSSAPAGKNKVEFNIYKSKVDCMLSAGSPFRSTDCLNFKHFKFGTALCQAVLCRNSFLVERLLLYKADPNIRADPEQLGEEFAAARKFFGDGSPVRLALGCYEAAIEAAEAGNKTITEPVFEDMENVIRELGMMENYPEEAIKQGEGLERRAKDILQRRSLARDDRLRLSVSTNAHQQPADFSATEKPYIPDLETSQYSEILARAEMVRQMFRDQMYGPLTRGEIDARLDQMQ